jgi:hypothetical protein
MTERIRGGRGPRPSRASGVPAKAAGALLAAAVVGSQTSMAAGSAAYWIASLPVVPLLSYLSWLATIRLAWDVTSTVSDEAVETVKTLGAEARNMAEAAGYEARSWVVTLGTQVRGVVYLAALFLGTFALWLLVTSLRKFWPTWPSPYVHAQRLEPPAVASGYAGGSNLSLEIRRRGQQARTMGLRNLVTGDSVRLGAASRGAREPQLGASPAWLAGLQPGHLVSFIYGRDDRVSVAAHTRQEGVVKSVEKLGDGTTMLEVHEDDDDYARYDVEMIQDMKIVRRSPSRTQFAEADVRTQRNKSGPAAAAAVQRPAPRADSARSSPPRGSGEDRGKTRPGVPPTASSSGSVPSLTPVGAEASRGRTSRAVGASASPPRDAALDHGRLSDEESECQIVIRVAGHRRLPLTGSW